MKYSLLTLLLILVPLQLSLLYYKNTPEPTGLVAGIETNQSKDVTISAFIGDHRFSLYGYTSPRAFVTFEGMGIFDTTTADDKGYFEFDNRFSPLSQREACLTSKDQFGRLSSPVCLPPFPTKYDVNIGPVIISPTVSLDKPDYFMGDQVMLSGQAVPNTDVKLSVFGQGGKMSELIAKESVIPAEAGIQNSWIPVFTGMTSMFQISNLAFIRPVEAFTFPELTARSDSKGNFSINLPSSTPEKFRLFAQTNYEKFASPNSVKLSFDILPVWMVVIKFFIFLFSLIRPRLLEIIIMLEIIYIIRVLSSHLQSKAIVLYQSHLPSIEELNLPVVEQHNLPAKIL